MRVIFLRKNAWTILFVLFIFFGANFVLLYKFLSRKNAELERAKLVVKNSYRHETKSPHINHVNLNKKYSSQKANHVAEKDLKEEDFVTMDMRRKVDDIEHRQENHVMVTEDTERPQIVHEKSENSKDARSQQDDNQSQPNYKFVILVIACNRPTVKRCLDKLIKHRPSAEHFPIVVSQDCGHEETAAVIRSYGNQVQLIQQPDLGPVQGVPGNMMHFMGYYKISRHFKWALTQAFDVLKYETVIIVEDDLDIAPDFFEYFSATRPLLSKDPTLWCVSAWNDNGKEGMVQGNDLLYRTDFFSGLGWMLTKQVWDELRSKWPLGFWDDWMRDPAQHKNRACIRPEICRTRTFGKVGVSQGQFFDQHLKYIKLNEDSYPFSHTDLSYLMKDNYDEQFKNKVLRLPTSTVEQLTSSGVQEAKVLYSSNREFESLARSLGAMTDFKAGIARVSYQGVVIVIHGGVRVFMTPREFLSTGNI